MALVKQEPKSPNSGIEDGQAMADVSENRCAAAVCAWVEETLYDVLKRRCDEFKEEIEPRVIYDFEIQINAMELLDFNGHINGAIARVLTAAMQQRPQQAVFNLIRRQDWLTASNSSQVLIIPRVTNLPTFLGDETRGGLGCKEKLVKIFGTIVSITPVLQYTKGTKYNCAQQNCQSFTGDGDAVVWLPGSSESSVVRSDYQCRTCSTIMKEAVQFRNMGEKRIAKLLLNDGISCLQACSHKKYTRNQAVTVILRDDLTTRIDIGRQYWITGMVVVDAMNHVTPQQFYFASLEAFDIEEARAATIGKYLTDEELPAKIRKLYEDRASSPWSFVASVAYCFGDSISIGGSYHKLKLALLLSLVLTGDDVFIEDVDGKLVIGSDLNKIHILAASEDILTIQRLFAYASTFCERSVLNQSCLELFGSTSRHSNIDGTFFVDGGSLLLAGRHVCIIPNVNILKKSDAEKLQKSLEETSICLNIPKRAADQSDFTQISFPLKCTIWAATESSPTKKQTSTFDLAYDFCGEHHLPEDIDDDNVNEMLRRSIGVQDEMEVSYEDLMKFIKFARSQRVNFNEDASKFLKSFFLASRRARSSGFLGAEIGKRALQTMMALTAAHAKLALRKEVTTDDALVAIILYEESLAMKSGQSVIDLSPAMHFSRATFAAHLGPKNDDWMRMLQAKISVFCRTYSIGMDPFHPEE